VGPLLAGHVLLGDAGGVMAQSAGGLHFGLHGSGRKRLAWRARRLRARQNDGCEHKDCRTNSLEQAGIPRLSSQFSVLSSQKFDNFVPQDDAISLLLFSIVVRLGFLERRRPVGG